MTDKIAIYPAAGLFKGEDTFFNSLLVDGLERAGYKTNFPQRDGFEFENLIGALCGKVEQDQLDLVSKNLIYFLDMGVFIPKSDVILANLNGPVDQGMVVEASYAKLMGKFNVGFRTDIRSPYGMPGGLFGGMHIFPTYQTHKFISHYMPSKTFEEGKEQANSLVKKIDMTIKDAGICHDETIPKYVRDNPNIQPILGGADLLFSGIEDIHSKEGLGKIVSRYMENREELEKIVPQSL